MAFGGSIKGTYHANRGTERDRGEVGGELGTDDTAVAVGAGNLA